ncbi:TolC family protein [Winogradskyella alexanderae]|uniref:TolC family protein n=1 Tax=Winogradskyella alexanderae TaxID=2877123 RepID=A0ABS7XSG9_9FLAO|nr:TolC family protein [Winogradskyella alexanderae]MCA0132963.1 TolC family protein [Winogradskyella alexanderae]
MNWNNNIWFCILMFMVMYVNAQEDLSKSEAIALALQHNFGILVASNDVKIAENNKDILNSGFLPTVSTTAGANYTQQTTVTGFPGVIDQNTGEPRPDIEIPNAETQRYNASVNLAYTLFDGMGRYYNYKRLKEQYNLSELEARETIENTIVQLFTVYYEVARLTQNTEILEETLTISRERLMRADYQFEYGQNSKLDVLNAQVDVANDSINLISINQQLKNTKRDLNVLLANKINNDFKVDTTVTFIPKLLLEQYITSAPENNVTLLQNQSIIEISAYDLKVSKSGYLPTVGLVGSYGWNENRNPASVFFPGNISDSYTFSAGINLSWNLFDGGTTSTLVQNSKIALSSQEIARNQIEMEVERDIANALGNYQNRLEVLEIQRQNVLTNETNFSRSRERYNLGQITAIEFRQAQINLILAETNLNAAKYDAKIAELQLLQLTGQLLNVEF